MRTGLLACALAYCMGCSSAPTSHPFTNAADAESDAGESEASQETEAATPVVYSNYCCKQAEVVQPCTLNPNPWGCVPFPETQPWASYDCTTPLCANAQSVGLYCIGINGPGTVVPCPQ